MSADGNTALVGGVSDNNSAGAAWVYTRRGEVWTQQSNKLRGSGAVGNAQQGYSVSLSADGNTALVGGSRDNGTAGAAWIYTRIGGVWTQQGNKLVGSGAAGYTYQGWSVSLSADGNTALVGGLFDNGGAGAAWVYSRNGGVWAQQGNKLVGSGAVGNAYQGRSVSLSADGNTALVGGNGDNSLAGAAWVYTRSGGVWTQQGSKLVGSSATGNANQGWSVSLSADGNTALVGGYSDNASVGAAWVYTRTGGLWIQQGNKLIGTGAVFFASLGALQGHSVSLSANGNTALIGGFGDNNLAGAAWVFTSGLNSTDYFRSITSGNWNDPNTWESSPVADFSSGVVSPALLSPNANANVINIRKDHTVTVTENVSTDQTFVNAGGTLSVTGSLLTVLNNGLNIQSNEMGTGNIGASTGTIVGNITVERYMQPLTDGPTPRRAYRLVTAPVMGTTINASWQEGQTYNGSANVVTNTNTPASTSAYGTMITGDAQGSAANANSNGYDFWNEIANSSSSIRRYDINDPNLWVYLNGNTHNNNFDAHQAYLLFIRGDRSVTVPGSSPAGTTLRATGNLKIGPVSVTSADQFKLTGNPYASAIDFDKLYTYSTNIKKLFYAWDPTLGAIGGYKTVVSTVAGYQAYPTDFGTPVIDNTPLRYIQSGQGFFVEKANTGNLTLNFTEDSKASETNNLLFRQGNGSLEQLRINLVVPGTSPILADGVAELYDNSYSVNVTDDNDVNKINNINENLAIVRNGKYLLVEARPLVDGTDTIFLSTYNMQLKNYQLQLKADNMVGSGQSAYLLDAFTQTETYVDLLGDITTYNFSITNNAASYALNRFKVVYRPLQVLPVTITQLKATQKQSGVQLDWTAQTEQNISQYEVEKSLNGTAFSKIGTVAARGNNSQTLDYNWLDANPVKGANYYRVKVLDKNGQAKQTNIVRIQLQGGVSTIAVYPNPVKGSRLNLELNNVAAGTYNLNLYNGLGQQVFSRQLMHTGGSSTQSIQLTNRLAKGVYQLRIGNKESKFTQTLIVE